MMSDTELFYILSAQNVSSPMCDMEIAYFTVILSIFVDTLHETTPNKDDIKREKETKKAKVCDVWCVRA